ncbi:MAG: maleylacetoacetate isomerase [Myxococcota bacterium]
MTLHDYWRSSASYRVRIGAALKGLELTRVAVDLRNDAHLTGDLDGLNPQKLVPVLETDAGALTQSLAILEYLDDLHPERPLLPADPWARAQQRSLAHVIACDVHPICNLRVLRKVKAMGHDQDAVVEWMTTWMQAGFAALEARAGDGPFLGGEQPMLPDVVLVPQMYNARRFEIPLEAYPKLVDITARCEALEPFQSAAPVSP